MTGTTKIGASAGAGLLALLLVLIPAAAGAVLVPLDASSTAVQDGLSALAASPTALADIPTRMLTLYQQAAATCPGLPWTVLAGIGKVETNHGRDTNQISSAGALGPMQFEENTFLSYAQPVPPGGADPPTPWDPTDAVYAASRLLCASGARGDHDIPGAIWAYNHSLSYVRSVLAYAREYAAAEPSAAGAPTRAAAGAVAYARSQLGVPYAWGAEAPDHAFDCSGLVQAAYASAGVQLPRTAQAQYDHGHQLPPGTPLLPGDLVFFGHDPAHIVHVGIAVGGGAMIDAPHTGAVVRQERIGHPTAASRPTG